MNPAPPVTRMLCFISSSISRSSSSCGGRGASVLLPISERTGRAAARAFSPGRHYTERGTNRPRPLGEAQIRVPAATWCRSSPTRFSPAREPRLRAGELERRLSRPNLHARGELARGDEEGPVRIRPAAAIFAGDRELASGGLEVPHFDDRRPELHRRGRREALHPPEPLDPFREADAEERVERSRVAGEDSHPCGELEPSRARRERPRTD